MLKKLTKKSPILVWATFVLFGALSVSFYYADTKSYYFPFPVEFDETKTPYTIVEIEGKRLELNLDLGSKFAVDLRRDALEKLESKEFYGAEAWRDLQGNKYVSLSYIIPEVKIGSLSFMNVFAQQLEDEGILGQTVWKEEEGDHIYIGSIGRPILERFNLLIDYYRARIIATNSLKRLRSLGYNLQQMQKVSFSLGPLGVVFKLTTELGEKNFTIDTGYSENFINENLFTEKNGQKFYTSICQADGCCLDEISFSIYSISPELKDIDGILGTPFLESHAVYIDFLNQEIYIRKSQKPSRIGGLKSEIPF